MKYKILGVAMLGCNTHLTCTTYLWLQPYPRPVWLIQHMSLPGQEQKKRNNWFQRWRAKGRLHLVINVWHERRKYRLEKSNENITYPLETLASESSLLRAILNNQVYRGCGGSSCISLFLGSLQKMKKDWPAAQSPCLAECVKGPVSTFLPFS